MHKILIPILVAAIALMGSSCEALRKNRGTAIGAGTGGVVGGVIGGLLGKKSDNTASGVVIGAAIGGVAGGAIGKYMDKQKRDMEAKMGRTAQVERVGEGLQVIFDSGLLFGFDSAKLSPDMQAKLTEFAQVLKEYKETNILIDGHTDSQGKESYNQDLSYRRAQAVNDFLVRQGVSSTRLGVRGFGETKPVATNDTDAGRKQNRRVEVAIWANDDLKKDAQDGNLSGK
ncbi:MAG TPA: OmpA family protein [Saprospiraceae bacterium]|nr:OmpA family protein [Saprospiraceae bacterium]